MTRACILTHYEPTIVYMDIQKYYCSQMSVNIKKEESKVHKQYQKNFSETKVNLNELLSKLKEEKKRDRKNNILLSAAAVSAVTVFGIILTL